MRIPQYDNFQVMPDTIRPVEAQAVAPRVDPGAQLKMVGGVANKAADILLEAQNLNDSARAKEADVAFADELRVILHDPENGYLHAQAGNAVDRREATIRAVQEAQRRAAENLSPGAQRFVFKETSARRVASALDQVAVHAARQTQEFAAQQATARASSQVSDMVLNWTDPERFTTARDTALGELDTLATLRGLGADGRAQIKRDFLTGAHTEVLEHIISMNRSQDARAYFERHQGEIDATRHDAIRKALEQVSVKADSLNLAMELEGEGDIRAQMRTLDGLYKGGRISAEIYDATRSRVQANWQMRRAQQDEGERSLLGQAQDWVLRNPGASVMDMPNNLYAWLRTTGKLAQIDSFARSAGRPETDPEAYYGLRRLAAEEPEQFAGINLLASRHLLSPGDWEEMVKLQTSINKADAQEMARQRVVGDTVRRLRADILAAGIDLTPKEGSQQAKDLAQFMGSITRSLDEAQRQKGAPLTVDEALKIGRGQLAEGWLQGSGWIFDDRARRYQVQDGADRFVTVRYDQIPPQVRAEIEADLRAAGATVTKGEVERIYQRAIDAGRVQ